jgi:UDP-GlcNAc:undecaprenyl-phosphate/decaprenyl-phosphate GlcNAc-1-phosphate transferase
VSAPATSVVCLVALPIAAATIWALLRSPLAVRIVAAPRRDRWHDRPTPTFGGVGIFAGFAAAVLLAVAAQAVGASSELFGVLGGAAIVFVAGLVDDIYSLPPVAKLGAQIAAAAVVLAAGLRVEIISNGVLAALLGGLWLVGMTNAFNLLDNMDGLAGTLAVIAATFFAIDAVYLHKEHLLLVLSLSIGFAALGFLPFNFRPNRPAAVFMGDSGSQTLGFVLAALGLATSWKVAESAVATLLIPLLVLAVPILDTALVTAVRFVEGRPITQGGRDHASHRLVRGGLGEKGTVVLLAIVAAGLGASSLAYSAYGNSRVTLVGVLVTFVVLVQFAGFLTDLDRGEADVSDRPVVLRLFAPRRLIEVLVDFVLISVALGVAYLLFTTGDGTTNQKHIFLVSLPVIVAVRYLALIGAGLYGSVWRFAGAREAAAITAAVLVSEPIAVGIIWLSFGPFGDFPAGIYVVDALFCIALIGASRFGQRGLHHALRSVKDREDRRRTLIVGAGRSGRSLLRELRETPGEHVVGFVDDDPRLKQRRLQGVPVLGGLDDIERVLRETRPDVVLVTLPQAPRDRLDAVISGCGQADITCRFVRREVDLDPVVVLGAGVE